LRYLRLIVFLGTGLSDDCSILIPDTDWKASEMRIHPALPASVFYRNDCFCAYSNNLEFWRKVSTAEIAGLVGNVQNRFAAIRRAIWKGIYSLRRIVARDPKWTSRKHRSGLSYVVGAAVPAKSEPGLNAALEVSE
jgi:hypothetical protein